MMNGRTFLVGIYFIFLFCSCASNNHDSHSDHADHADSKAHTVHNDNLDEIVISPDKAAAAGIVTEQVIPGKFSEIIRTSGEILPSSDDVSAVVATSDGIVKYRKNLVCGEHVTEGQELFVLSSQSLQDGDKIEKTRITFETARDEYNRASRLVGSGIVTQKEFAVIRENYEKARIAYEALKPSENGDGVAIVAPFNGYVRTLSASQGSFVTTGTPLALISRNSDMILVADLLQKDFSKRNSITAANFKTAYSNNIYSAGRLISIGKGANEGEYYIPVSFNVKGNDELLPGSFAEIWLLCKDRENVISVPVSALTEEQGLYYVYLKSDEECYRKQEVIPGSTDGVRTEIIKGLHPGENVVINGAYNVKLASASNIIPAHSHNH